MPPLSNQSILGQPPLLHQPIEQPPRQHQRYQAPRRNVSPNFTPGKILSLMVIVIIVEFLDIELLIVLKEKMLNLELDLIECQM
jgi:hypothetical protein